MGDIKWIKLATDLMDDSKIKHIRAGKNGDTLALLWVLLLCRAGAVNDGGRVYIAPGVPYTPDALAEEFRVSRRVAEDAVTLFSQLGMISVTRDAIVISQWDKHQNITGLERVREQNKQRQQRHRNVTRNVTSNVTVTQNNATEEEKEIEEEYIKKKLGINDAYKHSMRARAAAAQLIIDQIAAEGLLDVLPADLHSVVCDALKAGLTPDQVYGLAQQSGGAWAVFASGCATGGGMQ